MIDMKDMKEHMKYDQSMREQIFLLEWFDFIRKHAVKILVYTFLVFFALFTFIPFYWMIATALKTEPEITQTIPVTLYPHKIIWNFKYLFPLPDNFINAFVKRADSSNSVGFDTLFKNTVIVAFFSTLGVVVTTILSAFAFARLKFIGRDFIFSFLLATMMIPGEMLVITNFVTVSQLHWIDTFQALIIPFMTSVFYIFFLRQTFKQIPDELYYAAKVDGTGDFKYLWRIMIPIASPTIVTIIILNALGSWNAYIWPNLVTNHPDMRLITNGLNTAFNTEVGSIQSLKMAAATIVTLPILAVFLLLRKQIMRGVSRSGIKG